MAFFLSILYFVTYFLTPTLLFGPLAQFHIEIVLAVLIVMVSIPRLGRSFIFKTPQACALAGLSVAVFASVLFGADWLGGGAKAFLDFIPNIFAFFLVGLHCNSRKKLQAIVLMILGVCLFVTVNGARDLQYLSTNVAPSGSEPSPSIQAELMELRQPGAGTNGAISNPEVPENMLALEHPYALAMEDDAGKLIYRIRGLGQIHDPNDFGQVLVCEIPLLFMFWQGKKWLRNLFLVLIPACVLIYGTYLTHSRGALLALLVVILVAARRRIGLLPAGIIAAGLLTAAFALHFTGGRAISATSGSDRTALWGESLQILKTHIFFGVGMGQLPGYLGHTAHNSVVVCATELGLVGFFFWCLFLLPTMRNTLLIAAPGKVVETQQEETEDDPLAFRPWKGAPLRKDEINHMGFCLLLSLLGFLAAGWFLSRAFVLTLFLLGGMAEVVYENAQRSAMTSPRPAFMRTVMYSAGLMFVLLTTVYLILRILNIVRIGG